ncbi:sugar phosphate isomerase/epimerase family protein [Novosphingobium kunmingense]|uniref:sugar phosphate isomerase/epimerase family protein n=1 Tax=Novosphingobium kunmingense TaxID=1211806 RepID=UPI0018E21E78|nr:sugar phosphate isomerase/epimerase [Novosphingobium kunmingense]
MTVLEAGPFEQVRIARRCGYSHVGLRPVAATPVEPHTAILSDRHLRSELRALLDGEGIGVLDCEIVRLTDAIDWDAMQAVIDFTQEFGCRLLLVADNDPDPVRSSASLAKLAELSRPAGVTPCLEFMPWTCSPNLAAARARIEDVRGAALLIDAFHLARSGSSPSDLADRDPDVAYLQLCDIAGPVPDLDAILDEARSNRLFPGEGDIDLPTLLARFPGLPISLEVPADRLRDAGVTAQERARMAFDAARTLLHADA